jgi:hypothetical protein
VSIRPCHTISLKFPQIPPQDITSLFDPSVHPRLIECIADLLKYDPWSRLTSLECLEHPYLLETIDRSRTHVLPALSVSTSLSGHSTGLSTPVSQFTSSPRVAQRPPSHLSSHLAGIFETSSHRQSFYPPFDSTDPHYMNIACPKPHYPPPLQHSTTESSVSSYPSAEPSPNPPNDWDSMQTSPRFDIPAEYLASQPMDTTTSPMSQDFPARPSVEPDSQHSSVPHDVSVSAPKSQKTPSLPLRKQRWPVIGSMFGSSSDKNHLPPVDEASLQSQSTTPSLKRSQSSSTDSRSLPEISSPVAAAPPSRDPKKVKKEARRMAHEAEMQRRNQKMKAQQEQSRAVMERRNQIIMESQTTQELEWKWQSHAHTDLLNPQDRSRMAASQTKLRSGGGPIRHHENGLPGLGPYERLAKARRREFDDDHTMSSSDVRSSAVVSVMSFATNNSDPSHSLSHRHRPYSSLRDSSTSSPLGHLDDFSVSCSSDPSVSLHVQQASMDSSSLSDLGSPPPIHTLSLSPAGSWRTLHGSDSADGGVHQPKPSHLAIPSPSDDLPYGGRVSGHATSPGLSAPKSAINPMFKVVSSFSAR